MIKHYRILSHKSHEDLAEDVNEYIRYNWQPFGDLIRNDNDNRYAQAMVLYENGDKAE